MAWAVEFDNRAIRDLDGLPSKVRSRILDALDRLAADPFQASNVKALAGAPVFRLRVGDYRVVYMLRRERLVVFVVRVGHRREIYR